MSDDDDFIYVKKQKVIHYGSLEETEQLKLAALSTSDDSKVTDFENVEEKIVNDVGNVNISEEYMDIEDELSKDKLALIEEFARRRKARQVNVSTDDTEVKNNLRQLGEPICLFGEGPAERRIRLRNVLSRLGEDAVVKDEEERITTEEDPETTWYHEGPPELKDARIWIAKYSLYRAKKRLMAARQNAALSESAYTARIQEFQKYFSGLTIIGSQIGDIRPISYCCFSPNSEYLATASWSGLIKVWSIPDCDLVKTYKGHQCNVGAAVFNPQATLDSEDSCCALASCATDGSVKLWDFKSDEAIANLEGHAPYRVSRVNFHPSGRFLGTCCFDNSWRLWDLESQIEILHQEGHCKPVYCMSFQCDGSVVATGGLDSFSRVWDLRTGRCIMFMEGHLKSIYGIDFSPDGYHIATGSEDNSVRIWDLRKRACVYTIPAHMNLISNVKYQPGTGHYLITASYDNTAKVWSERTWQPLKTLSGHSGKILCLDIASNSKYIVTSSYDRTFKLWAPE